MVFSDTNQELISQLSEMVDELFLALDQLGEDTNTCYVYLNKVRNILRAKDSKGMKNVKDHLMMDFRMIEDRQLEGDVLDEIMERIYHHVNSNEVFRWK
ncbi:hypothetical protein [Pseudomonas lini]|uniref:hypothetical protein n=1 Tax=Pseudomonas lini TaxID=163011 RepID=UPI00345ED58D